MYTHAASLRLRSLFQCSKRGMLGEGSSVCSVSWFLWCSERGARGELICLYSLLFCIDLAKHKPQSCDMNIITWLFSHFACKEVYHIVIFICTACLFIFCIGNKLGKCIIVSYQALLTPWACSMSLVSYASATVQKWELCFICNIRT